MKTFIKCENRVKKVSPKKSIKLLCHLKKEKDGEEWKREFERSFDEEITILNGSFSQLRPIGAPRINIPSTSKDFIPRFTSTPVVDPVYEDVSDEDSNTTLKVSLPKEDEKQPEDEKQREDDETSNDDDEKGDDASEMCNETFDFNVDVNLERETCKSYVKGVKDFLQFNNAFLQTKNLKKVELHRKMRKYQRKMEKVKNAINEIEQAVEFSVKIPRLIDGLECPQIWK